MPGTEWSLACRELTALMSAAVSGPEVVAAMTGIGSRFELPNGADRSIACWLGALAGNNSKFLPASAPSQHAINLSAPFGSSNLLPIPVIAATTTGPLTAADISAVGSLQAKLHSVPGIKKVLDVGRSANGQAEQLLALAANNSGNQNYQQNLIDGMRAKIASAGLPA